MKVLDLFSGIGGFSLGLERAGMQTVAFCEIDPYCRGVLAKHWPSVPCYDDVRSLTADRLSSDGVVPDVICGGFPCQDISVAGKGAGIEGERSGLWTEYARLIGELRPRYVIVENVAALLSRGLDRVLGDLAALGFDAEWHCIPASAIGAPHRRDRIWIVAYPGGEQHEGGRPPISGEIATQLSRATAYTYGEELREQPISELGSGCAPLAPIDGEFRQVADAERGGLEGRAERSAASATIIPTEGSIAHGWPWAFEPDVGRVAHGVPSRVDRLKGLGNAVVPQIPEIIGRAIMKAANG